MSWFFKHDKKPSTRDIDGWLAGCSKAQLHQSRKQTQRLLFNAIGECMYPMTSDREAEVAYLLVHLVSGRGALAHSMEAFTSVQPEHLAEAKRIIDAYDWRSAPSEFVTFAGLAASIEISNEGLERHYDWALQLANESAARFFGTFVEPEMLRCRGVVQLALGNYSLAVADLERAKELKERSERETDRRGDMIGVEEPLKASLRLVNGQGARV